MAGTATAESGWPGLRIGGNHEAILHAGPSRASDEETDCVSFAHRQDNLDGTFTVVTDCQRPNKMRSTYFQRCSYDAFGTLEDSYLVTMTRMYVEHRSKPRRSWKDRSSVELSSCDSSQREHGMVCLISSMQLDMVTGSTGVDI